MNLKAIVGNHGAGNSLVSLPAGSHWWRPRGSHPIRVSQPVAWLVLAAKETTMIILIKIILIALENLTSTINSTITIPVIISTI